MDIPPESYLDFAREYFKLFDAYGDRPDKGDRGLEYRHLVGLPGGMNSYLYPALVEAANGLVSFKEGSGSDPDNLGQASVWVYDNEVFPFHQAEVYHQYHDGFRPGEQYPDSYHNLRDQALQDGRLHKTGCPTRFLL